MLKDYSFCDYRIDDTFDYGEETQRVCGFGIVEGVEVLFAANARWDIDTITACYPFPANELPKNIKSKRVLEKMTKADLIEIILGKSEE